jgi:hypothetical protein
MRGSLLFLLVVLAASAGRGQTPTPWSATLSGSVLDSATRAPIENANVYIANSTIGTSTDNTGKFALARLRAGIYDLVVSRVGYHRRTLEVPLFDASGAHIELLLSSSIVAAPAVEAIAAPAAEWHRDLEAFTKAFLGSEASGCEIRNPAVLEFSRSGDTLLASTDSMLIVRNDDLGYEATMVLQEFRWDLSCDCGRYLVYPRFRALAGRSEEQEEWTAHRIERQKGSLESFLRAVYEGDAEARGFRLRSGPIGWLRRGLGHAVLSSEITVIRDSLRGLATISFPGTLMVTYGGRNEEDPAPGMADRYGRPNDRDPSQAAEQSLMTLTGGPALIDATGRLLQPLAVELAGAWSLRRVSSLIPWDLAVAPR